jgi:hypothetical protein
MQSRNKISFIEGFEKRSFPDFVIIVTLKPSRPPAGGRAGSIRRLADWP